MSNQRTLDDEARELTARGTADYRKMRSLIQRSVKAASADGLCALQRIYLHEWPHPAEVEFRNAALAVMTAWDELGIRMMMQTSTSLADEASCIQALLAIAANVSIPTFMVCILEPGFAEISVDRDDRVRQVARGALASMMREMRETRLGLAVSSSFGMFLHHPNVAKVHHELFRCLAGRWSAMPHSTLEHYRALLEDPAASESIFQKFFVEHPQMLDPMAVEMWPQPDLHGAKEPDFVIRRADNTFLIVEIETPQKPLVTRKGQLSHQVTQAEQQVTDYRRFLVRNHHAAERCFGLFDEPDCLVVIGREDHLSELHRGVLRESIKNRHRLKIVGFDWLLRRAEAIALNTVSHEVKISAGRMI
jgi:Domain of unknown function (DUF4263)